MTSVLPDFLHYKNVKLEILLYTESPSVMNLKNLKKSVSWVQSNVSQFNRSQKLNFQVQIKEIAKFL